MLFNYGIIGSYLLAAFVLYFAGRIVTFPQTSRASEGHKKTFGFNDPWFLLRLLFLFFSLMISLRFLFLFAFPSELGIAGLHLQISYGFLGWLNSQAALVMIYLYFLVLLGLYFRMKTETRGKYLTDTVKKLSRFIFFDVFILFTLYLYFSYTFLFPHAQGGQDFNLIRYVAYWQELFYLLPLLLIPFIISYIWYRKKQHILYLKIYGIFFVIILLLSIGLSLVEVERYYDLSGNFSNRIGLYAFEEGFFGWFWICIVMLTILSFTMVLKIRRLKDRFITIQFYMNMMSHSIRFNFSCTIGLVLLTLMPLLMRIIYS